MQEQKGRERQPTAAILDSQTVTTMDRGGTESEFDVGKQVFGRTGRRVNDLQVTLAS
jgi:hypothetical protein